MWNPLPRKRALITFVFAIVSFGLSACSSGGGGGGPPPTGTLTVSVSDNGVTPVAIPEARITVIDGDTGEVIQVLTTDTSGAASLTLPVGQVLLRVAAQGYQSSPASADGFPLPYTIVGGQTTTASFLLTPLPDAATLGWISGRVLHTDGSTGVANALVLAQVGPEWYTTASASDGSYVLFNIPAGDGSVTALHAGYNFVTLNPVTVVAATATADQDIASSAATASVSGSVSFLAVTNSEVEVALLHPGTHRVVPGLRDFTSNRLYSISGIPNGSFDAIASLETDGYVMDPDAIAKFGVPQVTVTGGVVSTTPDPLNFAVTGAVSFTSPVNLPTLPSDAITISWNAYPSTKNYILELIDQNGDVIWGGYVPTAGTEYTVGTATTKTIDPTWPNPDLEVGKFYRVRVYASVDDTVAPFYTLISATEDLEGVFQVGPPTTP